ncbi:MAG: lipocalin family protein [Polaromonas sp.]|nr:lipocalin family protein [Polaromonas sp.]
MNKIIIHLLLALSSVSALAQETLPTIPSLDVPRYMGTWYEIAKYPNFFQRKCASNTVANYEAQPSGTVRVTNRCTDSDGKVKEAIGEVRQIGNATSPKLEVRFAPAWLSFLPFVWGNYWVIDLDNDYQLVAISEPRQEFLWVLCRTPAPNPEAFRLLTERLAKRGFDLKKMEATQQGKQSAK